MYELTSIISFFRTILGGRIIKFIIGVDYLDKDYQ